ncbi:MAG: hypothetical protein U9P11_07835 [Pseudomonadota bacterium]|nr:hypothetical protein [Pseudomonadota bacterium]
MLYRGVGIQPPVATAGRRRDREPVERLAWTLQQQAWMPEAARRN